MPDLRSLLREAFEAGAQYENDVQRGIEDESLSAFDTWYSDRFPLPTQEDS